MTEEKKQRIEYIAKDFASGFYDEDIKSINGSGWLIVDPMAAYLSFVGFQNQIQQIPKNEKHPQILVIVFEDGTKFVPAGGDLKAIDERAENWMWI